MRMRKVRIDARRLHDFVLMETAQKKWAMENGKWKMKMEKFHSLALIKSKYFIDEKLLVHKTTLTTTMAGF